MLLTKKLDSWLRLGFALVVFWAILGFTEMILADIAVFNASLDSTVVRLGYITAVRGILLLLALVAVVAMTSLLRRGLIIAPLVWIAQILRLSMSGVGLDMVKNMFFVSDILNLVLLMVGPALLSVLLWQSLDHIDGDVSLGKGVIPGLWLLLATLVSVGSLFVWHWSMQFGLVVWPSGYGLIFLIVGMVIFALGSSNRPGASLVLFFSGLLLPSIFYMVIWGWYDGINLAIISFLPLGNGDFLVTWVEMVVLAALPFLLVLGFNQFSAWRKGENLLKII